MKIFKFYSIFIGILIIIQLGINVSNSSISIWNNPIEKWEEQLVANRWKFETRMEFLKKVIYFKGEVNYNADGTLIRYLTCYVYFNDSPFKEDNRRTHTLELADLVMSGTVEGSWKLGDGHFWEETYNLCDMSVDHCGIGCADYHNIEYGRKPGILCYRFVEGATLKYGTYQNGPVSMRLQAFNKRFIQLEADYLSNGGKATFKFERLQNQDV